MAGAPSPSAIEEDLTVKAVHKRFEGLMTVRSKAIKGKGAWYWAHLEPILVQNQETGLPKAVKLRCGLCEAQFSASNPSRTASEHLKRGTCPNFFGNAAKPVSQFPISPTPVASRKRPLPPEKSLLQPAPLAIMATGFCPEIGFPPPPVMTTAAGTIVLSGGKEDLGALAMLEDSVKKLKSPKALPGPPLTKVQIDAAVALLAEWLHESCGAVSVSAFNHPKFKSFLQQVGLPAVSRREIVGAKLDSHFEEVQSETESRLRSAMFFQISSNGWKSKNWDNSSFVSPVCGENLVTVNLNLPNGTSLFRKAVMAATSARSQYAEEVLWDSIAGICSPSGLQRCVGIVADGFKSKALHNLELQHNWMVNLVCQFQGLSSLLKDFFRQLPVFHSVAENCRKLADFVNGNIQVRSIFLRYDLQSIDHSNLLRVPTSNMDLFPVFAMLDDVMSSARALQLLVLDEDYKPLCRDDSVARDVRETVQDMDFWHELEAVLSLIKLIRSIAQEVESDRPLVGRCLPLWDEIREKVKEWCVKYNIPTSLVFKVIERRFQKNYHPAWSAAYVLDPLYLYRDTSGKYLPPFKLLSLEQEKDVDKLITRLVSREEAHIVLMELMKWRSEGLDPLYAQAVQVKQQDPRTGKMKVANPQSSRLVWETCLSEFKLLGKVAVRLIFLHATACSFKCNWSFLRWICAHGNSRTGTDRVHKMLFIAANSKLERRDFLSEDDKDAELFGGDGDDDVLNEVLLDT